MAREKKGRIKRSHAQAKWKDMERSKHRPQFDKFVFFNAGPQQFQLQWPQGRWHQHCAGWITYLELFACELCVAIWGHFGSKYHVMTWWKHVNCWLVGASWDCDARLFRIQGDCASCALTVAGNLEAMGYQNQMHHQMPPSKTSTHSVQISFPQWTRFVWDTDRYCMILYDTVRCKIFGTWDVCLRQCFFSSFQTLLVTFKLILKLIPYMIWIYELKCVWPGYNFDSDFSWGSETAGFWKLWSSSVNDLLPVCWASQFPKAPHLRGSYSSWNTSITFPWRIHGTIVWFTYIHTMRF